MKMDYNFFYILRNHMDQYLSRNSNSNINEIGSVKSLDNRLEKSK
jgi:hypothetical protein